MSVITISRGTYSGGRILAECLADKLGYRCIDRDVIVEKAAASGVSQDVLREALLKPPTFLERFQHKKYIYLALIQSALAEEVRTGKAVYHGNAGHLLLKGGIPVLRTRIIAPHEFRLKMCMDRLRLSRAEALSHIHRMDQDRRKWTHYLYGVDWEDASLYDIVINLEYIDISEACNVIAGVTRERCFELTPDGQRSMDDFALASRVRAKLALNPSTEDLEVEVVADSGLVRVKGKLSSPEQIREVEQVAQKVAGVSGVNVAELVPPTPHA